MLWLHDLLRRKHALGLSNSAISRLSSVSKPTVDRILSGRGERASIENVQKIAEALEMEVRVRARSDADTVLDRRARRIANAIVRAVQGSSGLEAQAVSKKQIKRMTNQTVHELKAGPKRRLWEE